MGEVPKPLRLRALRMLDDRFLDVVSLDETDGIPGDPTQRALENFLFKPIPTRAFRKPHHVDLGHREKVLGMFVKKEQAHVLRQRCFTRAGHHSHLAAQRLHRQSGHLVRQTTAHLAQELLHQPRRKIRRRGVLVHAIIVGHLRRQTDQLALVLALGLDGAGIAAEVVSVFLRLGRHRFRNLVRSGQAARCPQHQQVPIRKTLHAQQREIRRLDQVAETQQLILDLIELVLLQAHRWKHRHPSGVAVLPDHHIAAAQVLEVIGEGTQRPQNRIWVPARLVFNALAFHLPLAEEVFEIDGEFGGHGRLCVFEAKTVVTSELLAFSNFRQQSELTFYHPEYSTSPRMELWRYWVDYWA